MFHGYNAKLEQQLEGCFPDTLEKVAVGNTPLYWKYSGDIGKFIDRWNRPVLIYPNDGDLTIGITQYNSFSQQ